MIGNKAKRIRERGKEGGKEEGSGGWRGDNERRLQPTLLVVIVSLTVHCSDRPIHICIERLMCLAMTE